MAGTQKAPPIGALTSDNRDHWTDVRMQLLDRYKSDLPIFQNRAALLAASPVNAQSLKRIESAMLVVCLDDTKPVTREDASWACWVGDGRNRFFDKHQRALSLLSALSCSRSRSKVSLQSLCSTTANPASWASTPAWMGPRHSA